MLRRVLQDRVGQDLTGTCSGLGTVLHDDENHAGKTIKVFYDSDREILIERARKFVAWHRNRDESVEAIEL